MNGDIVETLEDVIGDKYQPELRSKVCGACDVLKSLLHYKVQAYNLVKVKYK